MNIDRINRLANYILDSWEGRQFDMSTMFHVTGRYVNKGEHLCKTAGCIAGYALFLREKEVGYWSEDSICRFIRQDMSLFDEAEEWLGISEEMASALFMPFHDYALFTARKGEEGYITNVDAAIALGRVARGVPPNKLWDFLSVKIRGI